MRMLTTVKGDKVAGTTARFPASDGVMSEAVRCFDWSRTPLGDIGSWPPALRVATNMMLESDFPKCLVWGDGLVTIYNDAFKPILGDKPEALGRAFDQVWSEAWENIGSICEKAFAGHSTFIEDFPLTINRYGYDEKAFFTFCYSPVRDENGMVVGMIDTVIETTTTVHARNELSTANAELGHRLKNMLAMVAALGRSTIRQATSLEEAQTSLSRRINALAGAQDVLTHGVSSHGSVTDVVDHALTPFAINPDRLMISGEPILLGRPRALSLSLAINELATNAIKYGSLATDVGTIEIGWRLQGDRFIFSWQERGDRRIEQPSRRGFGSQLIEKLVASDFQGKASLEFKALGIEYVIDAPAALLDDA